jgi:hypothetical protein
LEIKNLTDYNFDNEIKNGNENPWLVIFYLETCPHCKNALGVFDKIIQGEHLTEKEKSLRVGSVECHQNVWSCMRFNITRVPYIILIEGDMMFEFEKYVNEKNINAFLNEEKTVENQLHIPAPLGIANLGLKVIKEAVKMINEYINDYLRGKGWNFKWDTNHTIVALFVFLVIMIAIEYMIVAYCCRSQKSKKTNTKEIKQQSENKKESQNKEGDKSKSE